MRPAAFAWLRCPVLGCSGPLEVGHRFPPRWSGDEGEELLEGLVACRVCEAEYPVLLGVAILVPEQGRYLWGFWSEIERCEAGAGEAVSPALRRYLGVPDASMGLAVPPDPWEESLDWTTSPYLQYNFDAGSLDSGLPDGWWRWSVSRYRADADDPYTYLMDAAVRLEPSGGKGLAVEVGASVGRTSADLALHYGFAVGIDWSFPAILAARRFHLRHPSPLNFYPLEGERGSAQERSLLPTEPAGNLEFVVGDGAALPFGQASAACVAALNVICAVPHPEGLLEEVRRVAAPGGLLLFSSPYWPDAPAGPGARAALSGPDSIRVALEPDFEIVDERDIVPWILRLAKRRWNVYLCHCLAARRR